METSKLMKAAKYETMPPIWCGRRSGRLREESVGVVQLYKALEAKKSIMERHYAVTKDCAGKSTQHQKGNVHFNKKYSAWKDSFIDIMTENKSIWNKNLGRIIVARNRIILNP